MTQKPASSAQRALTCAPIAVVLVLASVLLLPAAALAGDAYPAGATRPAFAPGAAQPRASAASTGGSSAPAAGSRASSQARARRHRGRPHAKVLHGDPARALVAYQAMQRAYYIPGSGLYAGEPFSYLWPFSQALAATITLADVPALAKTMAPEVQARLLGLQSYYDPDNSGAVEGTYTSVLPGYDGTVAPPAGPGGPKYYDDNDWIGIELMRLYKVTRSPDLLSEAESIMAFEMAGWQSSPALACPGGIPFSNSIENNQRNTVTTAPAAELAVQLYRMTGNPGYLTFAEQAYEWVRNCLAQPNYLYADHIGPKGLVEHTLWSYNQGAMIGAGTLLYQVTGNGSYLTQARQTAAAALSYFTLAVLESENPFFVSVYFRNLIYFDSVVGETSGSRLAQEYVNDAWASDRLPDDVFVGGSPASAQLLVQSAVVQIYGLLSTPRYTYF